MFCRALCLAAGRWAKSNGVSVWALVLNDSNSPDPRYVSGGFNSYIGTGKSKAKFIEQFFSCLLASRYEWIIFGHVSLSPLALVVKKFSPDAKIGIMAYGIEVWKPLPSTQRRAVRQADVILAISDYTKDELIKHNAIAPEKVRILPCSLDPHWEIKSLTERVNRQLPVILSVTRMQKEDRYKGIDNVIKSLPAVVLQVGPVEFRLVGRGDDVPRLKALAEGMGVSRYIKFMGGLLDEELRDQYQQCSLFVMPSRKEGFGIVFLEAMAYGKPVVGGAHGGTPFVVKDGETGLLVDSFDVEGITGAITKLLLDDEMREKFGRAGYQRLLDEFTFEKFQRNLSENFLSLA